jgi:phosphoribosyl 1,2-cyclic phosphodiesterase
VASGPSEQQSLPFGFAPRSGFASLGSGSRGNGTIVCFGDVCMLVDCGFSLKQTHARLARLGLAPGDLSAILVTHEHSDHIAGIGVLARRYGLPVYLSSGTLGAQRARMADWGDLDLRPFRSGADFDIRDVTVSAVPVPHDAEDPVQYVFERRGVRIGVLTDAGHVPATVADRYRRLDGFFVESNHDLDMLRLGPYPPLLQRRVGGMHGHLNNEQAFSFIDDVVDEGRTRVVVGHISEQNNCPQLLRRLYAPLVPRVASFGLATQSYGTEWVWL